MPRDLLAQQGGNVSQGRDLLAGQMAQQPSYAGVYKPITLPGRGAADIAAGLAQMGHGLMAAPGRIGGVLAQHGVISPETAARIPRPAPAIDYGKALGIEKPGMGDVLLRGLAQYSPYALAGGATLPGQVAAGGAFGATQEKHPITTKEKKLQRLTKKHSTNKPSH